MREYESVRKVGSRIYNTTIGHQFRGTVSFSYAQLAANTLI